MALAGPRRRRPDDASHADAQHPARRGSAPALTLTYSEAVAYVTGPGRFSVKLGLARTEAVLDALGHPERGQRGALVTGTNGKGSTCAFLASVLAAAGHRVGTMPSPHLWSYTERLQVNGVPAGEAEFAAAVEAAIPALDAVALTHGPSTEFEILTGVALAWFRGRTDRLVIEVGMGGRLDSTNVLDLGTAIVTNVGLDHQRWLGDTVAAIAREKAAIIKAGDVALTGAEGDGLRVVEEHARAAGVPLWRLGQEIEVIARGQGWEGSEVDVRGPGFEHRRLHVPLLGSFQAANAALAVAAAHALGDATPEAVARGLAATRWPGRLEVVADSPRVILDGGHNPAALDRVVPDLEQLLGGSRPVLVVAVMRDKDVAGLLERLRRLDPAAVFFTRAASAGDRALAPEELVAAWGTGAEAVTPAAGALERAREVAGPRGTVLACGSLYLVGELRHQLLPR